MPATIDLNADLGEGIGNDEALMELISSASIACGGHAGDAGTMRQAVRLALKANVRIGAHPGFVDPEHFGRRRLDLPHTQIAEQVIDQVATLFAIAAAEGTHVSYVKLHGALANMSAEDEDLARVIFEKLLELDPALAILALDNSAQVRAAKAVGLDVISEAYADRAYTSEGLLVPRSDAGAVIHDPILASNQVLRLARSGQIISISGEVLTSNARSVCIHSDTEEALQISRQLVSTLKKNGVRIGVEEPDRRSVQS